VWLRKLSDTRQIEWLAWRGATWSYLAYLSLILYARRRRDLAVLGLGAVILANQLNVTLNNPGQLVRYMAGPLILGVLLLPLAFARARPSITSSTAPKAADHDVTFLIGATEKAATEKAATEEAATQEPPADRAADET
jgi:hypothetical protein